jgi:hypothetical protein
MSYQPTPVGIKPISPAVQFTDNTIHTRILQNNTQYAAKGANAAYGAQTDSVADPFQKLSSYENGVQEGGRILIGWILDGTPIVNSYRVHLEKAICPILATAVCGTTQGFFGPTELQHYCLGTCVMVMWHDKINKYYIIGAIPDPYDTGKRAVNPYITQASRKRVDEAHKVHVKQPNSSNLANYSALKPFDATLGGEWGAVSTTGVAVTVDDFMAQLSVNEFCGVFSFYHDSLLRVAGTQFQLWTAGHERDAFMDQAEYNDIQGYTAFPWEAVGVLTPGQPTIKEFQFEDIHCPNAKPYFAHWESKNLYQQPYHRTQHFYGYLGQGGRSVLHAPPEGVNIWTYEKTGGDGAGKVYEATVRSQDYENPCTGGGGSDPDTNTMELKPCVGLHEDNIAMDGRRFIASAKGIVLAKRMLLPMPTRLRRPEDRKGDDAETNYKACGKTGAGPEHEITGDIKTSGDHPHLQRASAVLDLHGYLFNYAGLHPFHWHTKDFKLWQQSELKHAQYNHKIPSFSTLKSKMYLPEPQPKQIRVDHRYKTQKFYESESSISLLEDGSVVITDGYGAEIKMSAGCLTLSAPGDVWLKSGRSTQLWSGADCIVRAVDDVDISTTEKNVRIKSEQNLMLLAGNDSSQKEGGVLIESRAKSPVYKFEECGDDVIFGGIVLRAPQSEVVALGEKIYLRTGGGGSKIKPGNITIDAGRGEADIVTKSNNLFNYVGRDGQILHFFRAGADDETKKANAFRSSATLLCGPVMTDRDIIAGGNMILDGSVLCANPNAHIFTGQAAKGLIFVAPCDGDCADAALPALDTVKNLIEKELPDIADQIDDQMLEQLWYQTGRPGNAETMDIMEFSFRTDEQYKIPDFLLFEDRWQQMARLTDDIPKRWTEKPVTNVSCGPTYPFPGKKWLESDGFAMVDFNIITIAGGSIRDKDRGSQGTLAEEYRNPEFKEIQKQKINGMYPIVGRD